MTTEKRILILALFAYGWKLAFDYGREYQEKQILGTIWLATGWSPGCGKPLSPPKPEPDLGPDPSRAQGMA